MDQIAEIEKLLADIELSDNYKEALRNEQFKDRTHLPDLNQQLEIVLIPSLTSSYPN